MLAPAKTPAAVINRLNGEAVKAIQTQEVKAVLLKDGLESTGTAPAEYSALIKEEVAKWHKVVKAAGITAQ